MPFTQSQPNVPGIDLSNNSPTMVVHPFVLVDTSDAPFGTSGNPLIVSLTTGGPITLSNPPASTNVASDTIITFATQAKHWLVQNNTTASIYVELDSTASTSSFILAAGALWREDIPVTVIHIYTVTAQPINGATGIVIKGWS
jgi:hypothetical protein